MITINSDLIQLLPRNCRRGSKARCHILTHGSPDKVALSLSALAAPYAIVTSDDQWMPQGFSDFEEAQLDKAPRLLDPMICRTLKSWWLEAASHNARTPNFDIAATCSIDGKRGLLLVEAKAHDEELKNEASGRVLEEKSSIARKLSHEKIGAAISEARIGLQRATSKPWKIDRDRHYQMSNRFAWAWKLTQLGVPVVLVYLGFLKAAEMTDRGEPFPDHQNWDALVKSHSGVLFPETIWGGRWNAGSEVLIPLIRSLELPLN